MPGNTLLSLSLSLSHTHTHSLFFLTHIISLLPSFSILKFFTPFRQTWSRHQWRSNPHGSVYRRIQTPCKETNSRTNRSSYQVRKIGEIRNNLLTHLHTCVYTCVRTLDFCVHMRVSDTHSYLCIHTTCTIQRKGMFCVYVFFHFCVLADAVQNTTQHLKTVQYIKC